MLEVIGLTKIYKGKKGAEVRALDGVTLRFPEKGMVFLLGRSGSGKSTLLNVCGGLDSPTDGEIIVKGRSSKSFSQSDFDSYRNTYVGFIFQEYNILNDFTVEDNIALALELQGKPKKRKDVEEILEQVDLKGYGRRRPNTLSGGQKQRIAIARALVKSPEIIMADEPTGALDSSTGKQVLETLKKLSADKLVIVVSHDREFAEQYGDRIIELKDGKVISDVSKVHIDGEKISENISDVGGILSLKKGSSLTESDIERIKLFLNDTDDDIIIVKNQRDVDSFKKISGMTDDDKREVFRMTDTDAILKKEYSARDGRFIRSKLPLRHAVKMGVSGMKRKPFRLSLTILLCTVAFVLFGILSTLNFYSNEATFKETLPNGNVSILSLNKYYKLHETYYQNGEFAFEFDNVLSTPFGRSELNKLKKDFGKDVFGGVEVYMSVNIRNTSSSYWQSSINSVAYLPEGNSLRNKVADGGKLTGTYPVTDDQIAVSSYIADMLYECNGVAADGSELNLKSAEDIIGRSLNINGQSYTVVGIIDSGDIPEKFDVLKTSDDVSGKLVQEFSSLLADGLHLMVFMSEENVIDIFNANFYYTVDVSLDNRYGFLAMPLSGVDASSSNVEIRYMSTSEWGSKNEVIYLDGANRTLDDNETVVPDEMFYLLAEKMSEDKLTLMVSNGENIDGTPYARIIELSRILCDEGVNEFNEETGEETFRPLSRAELESYRSELLTLVKENGIFNKVDVQIMDPSGESAITEKETFTVIGLYEPNVKGTGLYDIILSDSVKDGYWNAQKEKVDYYSEYSTDYEMPADLAYGSIYLPYGGSRAETDMLWELYDVQGFGEDGSKVVLNGSFVNQLQLVDEVVNILSKVFLYVGIALALFAALLFSNFISTSISYKKREIGILRAVGARSFDVFKIFFSESLVISVICLILSTLGSIGLCHLLNSLLSAGIGVSLFVFGPMSFIVLTAIAAVTAFVATFLPVYRAARKKPVESIRSI